MKSYINISFVNTKTINIRGKTILFTTEWGIYTQKGREKKR